MSIFGRRPGGGRRSAPREPGPLLAVLTTIDRSRSAVLVDISCTGARISGDDLPPAGQELVIRIGSLEAFAFVVWQQEGEAGLTFDVPIAAEDVENVRERAETISLTRLSPEEKLALDSWLIGNAR